MWEKILGHPSADTYRWLLVAAGALFLIASARLARAGAIGIAENAARVRNRGYLVFATDPPKGVDSAEYQ